MLCKKVMIEAVTVCVGYADFLAETIPYNVHLVDLWTIVTTPEDDDTRRLCDRYGVRCLSTDVFYRDTQKPSINKSRGINYGLMHHSGNGWMLQLDADVVLPPQFRRMLENAEVDESCLYGMDRVNCLGAAEWDAFRAGPTPQYQWHYLVTTPRQWRLGARIVHGDLGGYIPPGFFQLWHPHGSGIHRYPIKVDSDMEHTDVLFAAQWPRRERILLPEGFCVHLETSEGFGVNWKGRKSPPFRPPPYHSAS